MLVHRRVTPSIKFTWVERGTVRAKCLAQEYNAMSPARVRTRTARSVVERTPRCASTSYLAGNHLYTWVERGTVRVKCLAQEHNTMTPAISNKAHKPLGQSELCCMSKQLTCLQWLFIFQDYIIHRLQMEDELIANVSKR